jgi:DNA-directed RNA polymerase specialized sigma24 family protein
LHALDPTRRHLVIAAYIRGESRKQLSQRFSVPVNTIKTWLRRALLDTLANLLKTEISAFSSLAISDRREAEPPHHSSFVT